VLYHTYTDLAIHHSSCLLLPCLTSGFSCSKIFFCGYTGLALRVALYLASVRFKIRLRYTQYYIQMLQCTTLLVYFCHTSLPASAAFDSSSVGSTNVSSMTAPPPASISNRLVISLVTASIYAGDRPISIASSDSYVVVGYVRPVAEVADSSYSLASLHVHISLLTVYPLESSEISKMSPSNNPTFALHFTFLSVTPF